MAVTNIHRVAFIGTGIMGTPIAQHIMDHGYELTVYNRTKQKADELVEHGATWADSAAAAAVDADVIFTMVGYPSDVEKTYLAQDGLLRAAKKGTWLIDLTTSSPQLARDIHAAAQELGLHAFDCPVTGGQAGAQAGTLTGIAGISEGEAAPVAELLSCFTSRIFYFDGAGQGQVAKLCNQVSLASCMVGMADALALAQLSKLNCQKMVEMVDSGMGSSRALHDFAPKILDGDYRPGFLSEHMRKDILLALDEAEELDITLPGTEVAYTLYDMLCQINGSRLGTQAISLLYAEEADGVAAGLDWSNYKHETDPHEEACEKHNSENSCECGDTTDDENSCDCSTDTADASCDCDTDNASASRGCDTDNKSCDA